MKSLADHKIRFFSSVHIHSSSNFTVVVMSFILSLQTLFTLLATHKIKDLSKKMLSRRQVQVTFSESFVLCFVSMYSSIFISFIYLANNKCITSYEAAIKIQTCLFLTLWRCLCIFFLRKKLKRLKRKKWSKFIIRNVHYELKVICKWHFSNHKVILSL